MITNSELKFYISLRAKKARHEHNKFLVEGEKLIREALDNNYKCEIIVCTKFFFENNPDLFKIISPKQLRIETIPERDIKRIQTTVTPQGIVGIFVKKQRIEISKRYNEKIIIVLENINDPGNVGSIIRNADWFGINTIILDSDSAEVYNPKTIRASAGSVFHLNILKTEDLFNALNSYKQRGYKLLCSDIFGSDVCDCEKSGRQIIAFCNEANGPSDELLKISDVRITIPKKGKAESLNVASASAIILSELMKN